MMAKRKKTLKVSKSSDDSITQPTSSPIAHIRKRIDDSIHELSKDVPVDQNFTPSPSLEPALSLACDPTSTVESGVCTSPRSLYDDDENTEHYPTQHSHDHKHHTKQPVTRTDSDILNQNHPPPYTHPDYHDQYAANTYPQSYHATDT